MLNVSRNLVLMDMLNQQCSALLDDDEDDYYFEMKMNEGKQEEGKSIFSQAIKSMKK